jgi:transcriptional regulator with XRE-family HTH domain
VARAAAQRQQGDETLDAALQRLLKSRSPPRSLRWLAKQLDVSPPFLSRAARRVAGKVPSLDLLARIADCLGVEEEWFSDVREARVIDAIRADPMLRDRLFRELEKRRAPMS